jgi:NitT/TauT family transport system substrate-binding protein
LEPLTRSNALKLLAAPTLLGLASANPAGAQTSQPVRIAGGSLDITAAGFYAQDGGFFNKVGLNAELATIANGAAAAAAIVSGTLEFGCINIVALSSAHENGIPFAWVAPAGAYSSQSPTAAMVVAKTSPIRNAKDLEGKTVAVSLLKQLADIALHSWLEKNGANIDSVKYVELPYSAMDAALLSGRIDAACIEEPVLSQTLAGNGRLLANGYDALATQFCEAAWVCSADYARANPDVIKKFSAALALTADWANKNRPLTAKILEKYGKTTLPPGMHRCFYPLHMRASDFQPVVDATARFGVIKAPFRVTDVFAAGVA